MFVPLPEKRTFDVTPYLDLLPLSARDLAATVTRTLYNRIALDVLRCERFSAIEPAPDIRGVPFDYLGFRDGGTPYLIVFRDPINQLLEPGETIKGRLTSLVRCVDGLHTLLFQVSLRKGYYRMHTTKNLVPKLESFVSAWSEECTLPIVRWIQERIGARAHA